MKLSALVSPPSAPTANAGDWTIVQKELDRRLPDDWKALVETYGYGRFGEFLVFFSPFFTPCTMMAQARGILSADAELGKMDGALPWAQSENGDAVYWLTAGEDPNQWPVAVWNPRGGDPDIIEVGAAEFLRSWLSGERTVKGFPAKDEVLPVFDRWIERAHDTINLPPAGDTTYEYRLAKLFETLEAVGHVIERRSGYGEGEKRQTHFVTRGGDYRFTYDTVYGHNVRLNVPKGQLEAMKALLSSAFID